VVPVVLLLTPGLELNNSRRSLGAIIFEALMRAALHRFDGKSRIALSNQCEQDAGPFTDGKSLKLVQSGQIRQGVIKDQTIVQSLTALFERVIRNPLR
jgi:hypothetical protein